MGFNQQNRASYYLDDIFTNQVLPASSSIVSGKVTLSPGGGQIEVTFEAATAITGALTFEILGYKSRELATAEASDALGSAATTSTQIVIASKTYAAGETIKAYVLSRTDGEYFRVKVTTAADLSASSINVFPTITN